MFMILDYQLVLVSAIVYLIYTHIKTIAPRTRVDQELPLDNLMAKIISDISCKMCIPFLILVLLLTFLM